MFFSVWGKIKVKHISKFSGSLRNFKGPYELRLSSQLAVNNGQSVVTKTQGICDA